MDHAREAKITSPITTLKDSYVKMIPLCFIVGVIGMAVAIAIRNPFGSESRAIFFNSYLTSFCFVLTISLGCLFIVTVLHLTRAGWGVTIRRIAELYAACLFPLLILFLPILIPLVLFGSTDVYEWNQPGWSVHDATEAAAVKQAYSAEGASALPPLGKTQRRLSESPLVLRSNDRLFCDLGPDGMVLPGQFVKAGPNRRQEPVGEDEEVECSTDDRFRSNA